METMTIDELIENKKCLDMLYDGVRYELNDSICVDIHYQDGIIKEIDVLSSKIVEVFYAWLRHNHINIDTDLME